MSNLCTSHLLNGIRYAFHKWLETENLIFLSEMHLAIALIEHVLLDKSITHEQNEHIKSAYKEYQSKMKSYQKQNLMELDLVMALNLLA
jgi:succinate dehydrogenase/fumarate reductase cytochrome b subunit